MLQGRDTRRHGDFSLGEVLAGEDYAGEEKGAKPPEPLRIGSRDELATRRAEIFTRLNARPDLARLMFINPVQALADVGVILEPSVATHVLHAMQLPPAARERRKVLERDLHERLGERPAPLDPKWLARAVFEKLELQPKCTDGREPVFRPALNAADIARLQRRRPAIRPAPDLGRPLGGVTISVAPWRPAFRRMDLDAPVPELPAQSQPPKQLALTELWFYKDDDPAAHDLLELGVIVRTAIPVHSADGYRKIKANPDRNAFTTWITSVRFPDS